MYRPLPKSLTISKSPIEGLGLFATEDIPLNTNLGMSHIIIDDDIIRTPLAGFYNHSDSPNCIKVMENNKYFLITTRYIQQTEEITVKYTLYHID